MVGYVATGIIFAVLESPKSFTGTRHARSCLIIILNTAAREHPCQAIRHNKNKRQNKLSLGMRRVFGHFHPGKSYNDHFILG